MSIFLNWKQSTPYSKERFISNLFSRLSPRWYPTNVIGSSVYDIFNMYGDQLYYLYQEYQKVQLNQSILNVSTGAVSTGDLSKLYYNFGLNFNYNIFNQQNYDQFNSSSIYSSYRNSLRFMIDSSFSEATIKSLKTIGQAYTGMSPDIDNFAENYKGWILLTVTGSLISSTNRVNVISPPIPRLGNVLPLDIGEVTGSLFSYSRSKLGVNTKVYSKSHYYNGIDITLYGSGSLYQTQIHKAVNNIVGANQYSNLLRSDEFVYWRPSFESYQSPSVEVINDYLTNIIPVRNYVITGSVIQLPSYSANLEWKYDWSVRNYNDSNYEMNVRWYPSASIPNTIYFLRVDSENSISRLPFDITKGGSHYLNTLESQLSDISGNQNTLYRNYSSGSSYTYRRSRHQDTVTTFKASPIEDIIYTGSSNFKQNFTSSFYFEFWVNGFDNNFNDSFIQYKRQDTATNLLQKGNIENNGWSFLLDSSGSFSFNLYSSSTLYSVTCSVLDYLLEDPNYWHYFAGTYSEGEMYLYSDGELLTSGSLGIGELASFSSGYSSFIIQGDNDAGIDEIVIQGDFLSPSKARENFNNTKPRIRLNSCLASGSMYQYHQPMLLINASGSQEIEWHEFSILGRESHVSSLKDRYYIDYTTGSVYIPPVPPPPVVEMLESNFEFASGSVIYTGGELESNFEFASGSVTYTGGDLDISIEFEII